MIVAVMQPYFMPYLGYFQLARSCDHFVFLDDVNFIRRGFINRNRILLDGKPFAFSLPVIRASQNRPINRHSFTGAMELFLEQLRHAYRRAPFYGPVFRLVESLCLEPDMNVARKAAASVAAVFAYLGLPLNYSFASSHPAEGLGGECRILDICRRYDATAYHNAPGGRHLYDVAAFRAAGVCLRFVKGSFPAYGQPGAETFVPGLSIIDVLMNNAPERVSRMLDDYVLEHA